MKLLETSHLVDYLRGTEAARQYYQDHAHDSLAATTVSMFELAFGVGWSGTSRIDDLVESLAWVEFLPLSTDDALEAARIQAELQTSGDPIPITDLLVAGVARNRGADLVAGVEHFERVDGLNVDRHRPD